MDHWTGISYNGNNPRNKMFANWQLFLIHKKTFVNGDNPSRIYSFLVQLPISPLATPIFPIKVATVEALQSSVRQCSSYSGHTPFYNYSIVSFFQNILTLKFISGSRIFNRGFCSAEECKLRSLEQKKVINLYNPSFSLSLSLTNLGFLSFSHIISINKATATEYLDLDMTVLLESLDLTAI